MSDKHSISNKLVRDLMTVGVQTCSPSTPVLELVRYFLEAAADDIVVLDEGNAIGVIGTEELIRAYTMHNGTELTAADVMREDVPTVPADIPVTAAAQLMLDMGVKTVFLTHHAAGIEYPAAMLSFRHILRHFAADEDDDLRDLGIYAERKAPLQSFFERRDAARLGKTTGTNSSEEAA
ncbi:MAG: CBS domain-containing protein [Anaerolineales bacterium]|nr:MAG: CBS domain-containing protein [Anaerolineales bacterium]